MSLRFSLTISDLNGPDAERILRAASQGLTGVVEVPVQDVAPVAAAPAAQRVKRSAPAALPAAPQPAAAPSAPINSALIVAMPAPAGAPAAAPAPAPTPVPDAAPATDGALTLEALTTKARLLGTGPLKQLALLAVLNAMGVQSLGKVPKEHYPALDRLLDAANAYGGTPGATLQFVQHACPAGQYDAAAVALNAATAASMGL